MKNIDVKDVETLSEAVGFLLVSRGHMCDAKTQQKVASENLMYIDEKTKSLIGFDTKSVVK